MRVVQLTPPGSGCSIVLGMGLGNEMAPGSLKGLQLVVPDIDAAHTQLVAGGVEVSPVSHFEGTNLAEMLNAAAAAGREMGNIVDLTAGY